DSRYGPGIHCTWVPGRCGRRPQDQKWRELRAGRFARKCAGSTVAGRTHQLETLPISRSDLADRAPGRDGVSLRRLLGDLAPVRGRGLMARGRLDADLRA